MDEGSALLQVRDITITFGGLVALDAVSFDVEEGMIVGLIGPNGAGKTTMFNCITRLYKPDSGSITFAGSDLLNVPAHGVAAKGITRTFQNLALFPSMTVIENVLVGRHHLLKVDPVSSALRLPNVTSEERSARIATDHKPIEYMFIQTWNEKKASFDFDTTKIIDAETTKKK